MLITLKNFGTTLVSRPSGSEAFKALQPLLSEMKSDEPIELDFAGVVTFTPSWGDEVLTPLEKTYGDRLTLIHTNESVAIRFTIEFLERIGNITFTKK